MHQTQSATLHHRIAPLLLTLAFTSACSAAAQRAPSSGWESQLDSLVRAELERTLTPGAQVAVAHNGRVIYAKGFGVADIELGRPVTAQTLFRVGSVTKMVTGAVAAELAADGTLDLDAPIRRYVPGLAGRRVGTVTTRQLLHHTAGWIDNAVPFGRMGEAALGEVMDHVSDSLFFADPGRIISYSNPGYSMAGYVAERTSGQRFGSLAEERVLRKMGMPHATFRPLHAMTRDFSQGHVGQPTNPGTVVRPFTENTAQWAAGFLMASAQDMARFAIAVMDGGMLDGERVLSARAVELMTAPGPTVPGDSVQRYAFGLMLGRSGAHRVWQHGGAINGFDAQVTMFPDQRLAVVVLDNRSGNPLQGIVTLAARQVGGVELPPPTEPGPGRAATATERQQLVGSYRQGPVLVEIVERGDSLVFRQGPGELPLRLLDGDRLLVTPAQGAPLVLPFVRGPSGRIEFLHRGLRAVPRVP